MLAQPNDYCSAVVQLPPSNPFGCRGPEWTTFWDSFESAVHTNPDLTGVDKFNYLHSLLDTSAAEAVSGLKLTAANYELFCSIMVKTQTGPDRPEVVISVSK